MSQRLPEHIDPFRLVSQKRILNGGIELSRMPRLFPLLRAAEGIARLEVEFGTDDMGVPFVIGRVAAELPLTCQRCLQPMVQAVNATISLGIVATQEAADTVPAHYDPLIVEHAPIPLVDIVEDELLLSLPLVALHAEGECEAAVDANQLVDIVAERKNPFAVLAQLKPHNDEKN